MGGFEFDLYGSRYGPVMGCCGHANEPLSLCSLLKYCNYLYNKIHKANKIRGVISSSVYVDPSSGQPFLLAYKTVNSQFIEFLGEWHFLY
jgi:hypothetical protein